MATKIKGIRKGFKYISQIFVVKDRELDIGYPTDVKHVSHVGWDGSTGNAPCWMNEFKTSSDFTSIGNIHELRGGSNSIISSTWTSQDFESMDSQPMSEIFKDTPPMDMPDIPKKQKRKNSKSRSSSSSSSTSAASSRSSRATAKLKSKFVEGTERPENRDVVL